MNKEAFSVTGTESSLEMPKVSGGELISVQYLNKVLVNAEDEAKAMGDEYVSVEHLFLSLLKYPNPEHEENWRNMELQESVFFRHFLQ